MRDPFPFAAPAWLQELVQPLAEHAGLTTLPLHVHELASAALFYTFVWKVASPALSARLFPATYRGLDARSRLNWDVHVVSLVQSTLICAVSAWIMVCDDERRGMDGLEKIHGYSPAVGMTAAFACGYFLWDFVVTGLHLDVFGVGMLAHAVSALTVFSLGFRPFLYYYCPTFLLYELSSPFLNIHWFMDKLGMTGSLPQLVNGIILLSTFAGARLVWGTFNSACVYRDMYRAWAHGAVSPALFDAAGGPGGVLAYAAGRRVPAWLALSYVTSNLILNGLNWYWFEKMIATIRRRFDPPFGTRRAGDGGGKEGAAAEVVDVDAQLGRYVYADGRKGVEAEAVQVKKRPAVKRLATDVMSPVHA